MYHQGYALKKYLETDRSCTLNDFAKSIDISRQGVQVIYGHEVIAPKYISAMKEKGYKIPGVTVPLPSKYASNIANEDVVPYGNNNSALALLQKDIEIRDEKIKRLETEVELLKLKLEAKG